MTVLDANVVIAFLSGRDVHHQRARQVIDEGLADGFVIHPLTLAEILVGPTRNGTAQEISSGLAAMGVVVAAVESDEPMLLAEVRASSGLRMPDCCVIVAALRERRSVATFDGSVAREAKRRGLGVVGSVAG